MSEPLAVYDTGEEFPRAVHCPHCGDIIGWYIIWRYPRPDGTMEEAQVFRPCDLVSDDLHGWYCLHCGERYHAGKREEIGT